VTTEEDRIRLALSCRDTEAIPKVSDAGAVTERDGQRVQTMHNGVLVVEGGYYGEWMTAIIRGLRGHHEPQEEVVFHAIVERLAGDTSAPTMIELGAFWAYYSLWLLHRRPDARVILVEPDPANLGVGLANAELNGRHVEAVQAAVGRAASPPRPFRCESDGVERLVGTESLRSLVERFSLPRVDLLLVDVQGAEVEVLEGAGSALPNVVRFAVVSTHHHMISGDPRTHQRCVDLIRNLGGHVIAEHTVAESFSGDGLIAASFDPRDADLTVPISYARATTGLYPDPLVEYAAANDMQRALSEELEEARGQLAAIKGTSTWRLHEALLRSSTGRHLLSVAGRVLRAATERWPTSSAP
jgi:FkbM family methyltransferase